MSPLHCLLSTGLAAPTHSGHKSAILPLTSVGYGFSYDVAVQFGSEGNKQFQMTVDTGSADSWILGSAWQCFQLAENGTIAQVEQDSCPSQATDRGFEVDDSVWFGQSLGAGDTIGTFGYDTMGFPGCGGRHDSLSLPRQEFAVANTTIGAVLDGFAVGILGFGYPSITYKHPNTLNIDEVLAGNASLFDDRIAHPTVFESLVAEGIEPYISLALERTPFDQAQGFGGYLALGTLPPVPHGPFVVTPVEITENLPLTLTNNTVEITEWTLRVQAVTYTPPNSTTVTNTTNFQAVVDSGQNLNLLPFEAARDINAAFDPPATLVEATDFYTVSCNATPPRLGITIANHTFAINALDMIWRDEAGTCYSSVLPAANDAQQGISLNFLGDAFLKNVVAVFDAGKDEMRFAERL
ncbi:hypothetical protein LTR86_010002 [Recurvomyces mirabilis]|nr:hypothetical protein LTR86_010002 [Recurvomyces mirabilis]